MEEINFKAIEKKWQDKWENEKVFQVKEDPNKKKYYCLEMFPYPSGSGLHMGHAWNYTIGDIIARFKILKGLNVLHPMGYDSLGLPAENAAIIADKHPCEYTDESIINFEKQFKSLGISYDWSRSFSTHNPKYYKWDQWIFLKMLEKGLAYQKTSAVNWCSKCQTVLANEQVTDGKCWRHDDTDVEIKHLKQWFLKTTKYADELYENLDNMDWPEKTKAMQKNWIGKSHGTEIDFEINGKLWPIFTTRPDTIFGVTFMVVSAQHKKLWDLVTSEQKVEVEEFLKKLGSVSEKELADMEKLGVFTGSYAINPATNEKVPVYAGNFVVADYGSGMVMAVPSHDQRDFEFAKKYGIEIKQVVRPVYGTPNDDAIHRDTISAVVRRKSDDKFLMLKWNKFDWISPVIGGIEEGETVEEAAIREVKEETGYNTKFIKVLGEGVESHFFANNKNVWRSRMDQPVLLELIDEEPEQIEEEERKKHNALWLDPEDALEMITHKDNCIGLLNYLERSVAYTGSGKLVNSNQFNGISNIEAKEKITSWLAEKNKARKVTNFKLRDWGISRQRYWGTPIPVVYCESCGVVPVEEKDLPVELPKEVKFGKGNPLETCEDWINTNCPKCGSKARRETDTMDTFVNSSWYFLRYCDPKNDLEIFDKEKTKYWSPVDIYVGGSEHACMHLIYSRFYVKFLRDLGLINFDEPAKKLFHQGMLSGEGGVKMSKSKPETCVLPEKISDKYGIDTARFFLSSLASPDKNIDWSEKGIIGSLRFIKKIFDYVENFTVAKDKDKIISKLNKTIKNVEGYYSNFEYRKATIELRELFDLMEKEKCSKDTLNKFLQLLNPICPHITEELWEKIGNDGFVSKSSWPTVDESKINLSRKSVDINSKIIEDLKYISGKVEGDFSTVYIYVMPFELEKIDVEKISDEVKKEIKIFAVNDSSKYDPENRSKKSKPGRPSIYVE